MKNKSDSVTSFLIVSLTKSKSADTTFWLDTLLDVAAERSVIIEQLVAFFLDFKSLKFTGVRPLAFI